LPLDLWGTGTSFHKVVLVKTRTRGGKILAPARIDMVRRSVGGNDSQYSAVVAARHGVTTMTFNNRVVY